MSKMTIDLSPADRAKCLKDATAQLAERLYNESDLDNLQLISRARAAGLLDVDPKTLDAMGIPRINLSDGKLIKYRLSDIAAAIAKRLEK